jgi:hypothetical protein
MRTKSRGDPILGGAEGSEDQPGPTMRQNMDTDYPPLTLRSVHFVGMLLSMAGQPIDKR